MSDLSAVKALVFDVFGTVVDWRTSLIADLMWWGKGRGISADWTALVDGWRGMYTAAMDDVRKHPERGYVILDRPRHADLVAAVRKAGAAVRFITDGDVAGVIHCADPDNTGVDMYLGTGGAPEGVLAAVALRCIGGQMQCRLILDADDKRERAAKMGVNDPKMIYGIEDLARGDCLFAATGVTTGSLLSGVKFRKDGVIETETVVMRSVTGTVRYIRAEHRQLEKFHLD